MSILDQAKKILPTIVPWVSQAEQVAYYFLLENK